MTTLAPTRRSVELRELIAQHHDELLSVFERYGATNARVFGSVARGEADEGSDIDLLFTPPDRISLMTLSRAEGELSDILGVPVDLVPDTALLHAVRPGVLADARAL